MTLYINLSLFSDSADDYFFSVCFFFFFRANLCLHKIAHTDRYKYLIQCVPVHIMMNIMLHLSVQHPETCLFYKNKDIYGARYKLLLLFSYIYITISSQYLIWKISLFYSHQRLDEQHRTVLSADNVHQNAIRLTFPYFGLRVSSLNRI